ncbi:MAG: Gx transporter family protein [Spirochaetales bacterium]|nr:Gx transporter family protein [Spirochaetales bacterium]
MAFLSEKQQSADTTAFFGALCLFFSTLEYLFPRPVPFFRLGLANLPIMLAIDVLSFPQLLILGLLKVLGQGLIHGTLASYVLLFSFCGTFSSLFVMYGARRIPGLSYLGVSVLGALVSNTVQIGLSLLLVFGTSAALIIPYFYTMGLLSGAGIGLFANWFTDGSAWYTALAGGRSLPGSFEGIREKNQEKTAAQPFRRKHRTDHLSKVLRPGERFTLGLALIIPLVFQESLVFRAVHLCLLAVLCVMSGKRLSWLYFINLLFWITLFQQLSPFGRVLAKIGPLSITRGALEAGIGKSLLLIGLVFTSLFSVTRGLKLPGKLGGLIGRMFYYFEQLYQGKHRIRRKSFLRDIDLLLKDAQALPASYGRPPGDTAPDSSGPSVMIRTVSAVTVLVVFYSVFAAGLFLSGN